MDTDDPEHISWLYNVASARANEFKIEGVTWSLTQGVVKNIIPAIASTNAIIAGAFKLHIAAQCSLNGPTTASCCNEAFKIATSSAAYLNNYFMLIGTDGVYSYTFEHEKREDCPVCGGEAVDISISREWKVERLIEMLVEKQDMCVLAADFQGAHSHTFGLKVKSRSHHCPQGQHTYISRRRLSSSKPLGRTLRKKCQSWYRMAEKSRSLLLHYPSVCLCAFRTHRICSM